MVTGLLWYVLAGVASLGLMCVLIFVSTEVLHEHEKDSTKGGGGDAAYRIGGPVGTGAGEERSAGGASSTCVHSDIRRGKTWFPKLKF